MTKSLKVLFLCAGNTCRSPLVEGLARQKFGGAGTVFASAGLGAATGEPVSHGSLMVAAEFGVDLSGHRSRSLTAPLLADVDWVVTMTRLQAAQLRANFPAYRGRIGLLGLPGVDLTTNANAPRGEDLGDPFGEGLDAYHAMSEKIERWLDGWRATFAGAKAPADGGGGRAA